MVKDAWDSFKDNIKDRITNPFLGTFVIVWIAHNWKVVYAFFNFDKEMNLNERVQYFNDYWKGKSFFWDLMCIAAITVGILIITYLFLALSRLLANLFENVIIPYIQGISKGKIVTGETHQKVLDRVVYLESRVEDERRLKIELQDQRDGLEKRLLDTKNNLETAENIVGDVKSVNDSMIFEKIEKLALESFEKEYFDNVLMNISKGRSFSPNEQVIDFLSKYGLIEYFDDDEFINAPIYKYTSEGTRFVRYHFINDLPK